MAKRMASRGLKPATRSREGVQKAIARNVIVYHNLETALALGRRLKVGEQTLNFALPM